MYSMLQHKEVLPFLLRGEIYQAAVRSTETDNPSNQWIISMTDSFLGIYFNHTVMEVSACN